AGLDRPFQRPAFGPDRHPRGRAAAGRRLAAAGPVSNGVRMTADIAACKQALAHLDIDDNPATVQQKSRDFYWYSPILRELIQDVTADFVVAPRSVEEVAEVLAVCWKYNVPVTTRGGGTGNYGQAMPLSG